MLDFFTILTKGGIVLWSKSFTRITSSPVNSLIGDVLIEERAGENSYTKDSYSLKWTFANELDLIFVAAYQKILQLAYIEELLATVKKFFCDKFANFIKDSGKLHKFDFDEDFGAILNKIEEKDSKSHEKLSKPRPFEKTKKFKETAEGSKKLSVSDISKPPTNPIISEDEIARNIEELHRYNGKRGRGGRKQSGTGRPNVSSDEKKQARKKTMRVWDDKVSKAEMESLDYSGDKGDSDKSSSVDPQNLVDQNQLGQFQDGYYEVQDIGQDDDEDEFEEDDYNETNDTSVENNSGSSILSFFKSITGQKEITEQDLVPVLAKMKEHLIKKNVAADIAAHLCDSVARNLVGQKTGSFKSIQSTVKQSMEMSLKRILTPKTSVDLLRDIAQAQSDSRPYTICFIGVNDLTSTNLSKTCFWLLQNGLKVLIAACDTFRSGAVEQLRVHVRNLNALGQNSNVELYERGYGKDAAGIAKDAINYAKINKFEVVLIDTAGRMQDNEPLMRALAKLVSVNNPDKIIFVGEALVGNEAVDQLTKFNQALKDFSGLQNPRHIDGMILTKFDTVDDKVWRK
ncbi:Srp101p [Rhizophagus irregularis DAOM 197198w]|uniref:Signal recognition particle receptor subunit alpha homolog n=1 Tax=Rhizophagus irregularis (strain DAOM 197198w) TaxID=1432141 RepID=A0A015L066_RHIIW|nr:Srp101p [Rhizophagus irregularis DAOM 197198w]